MTASRSTWIVTAILTVFTLGCGAIHLRFTGLRSLRLQQLHNEIALEKQSLDAEDEVRNRVAVLQTEWVRQTRKLSTESHPADVLEALTTDLNELGIRNLSLASGTQQTSGLIRRIPLSVSFTSSFATAFELFDRLATRDSVVRINRVVIRRDAQTAADALTIAAQLDSLSISEDHVK